jgi:hypothetical protein
MEEICGFDLSGSGCKKVKYSYGHDNETLSAVKRGEVRE